MASDLHRTATTTYLCYVPILEDSAGAGRVAVSYTHLDVYKRQPVISTTFSINLVRIESYNYYCRI